METLPNGVLPAGHELLHYLLTVKMLNTGYHKNSDRKVALDVVLQWVFHNIYPKDFRTVENNLCQCYMSISHWKREHLPRKVMSIGFDTINLLNNSKTYLPLLVKMSIVLCLLHLSIHLLINNNCLANLLKCFSLPRCYLCPITIFMNYFKVRCTAQHH